MDVQDVYKRQIEYHPGYLQQETVDYCQKNGIQVEAWSPLGNGQVLNLSLIHICFIIFGMHKHIQNPFQSLIRLHTV